MRYTQRTIKVRQCLLVDYFGHREEIDCEVELDVQGTFGAKRQLHLNHMDPDYDGPEFNCGWILRTKGVTPSLIRSATSTNGLWTPGASDGLDIRPHYLRSRE